MDFINNIVVINSNVSYHMLNLFNTWIEIKPTKTTAAKQVKNSKKYRNLFIIITSLKDNVLYYKGGNQCLAKKGNFL